MPDSATTIASPLTLPCGAVLPNRIAKAAMTEGLADAGDNPTPALGTLYRTWSDGGAGLLITGNVMVDRRFLERGGNVVLEDERALEQLKAWAKAGTAAGNHLWMQINHPGRQCSRFVSSQPLSPSDVQLKLAGNFARPRAMTEAEILDVIQRFARTAALARTAGFTGVQIHSAHGYLGSQFLSPATNRRTDRWGGSLENRARFLLETVAAVRQAVGPDFPIGVKLNSADFQKGGFTLEECVQVSSWLGQAGIDLLEISGGTYENLVFMDTGPQDSNPSSQRDSTRQREAFFLEYADAISRAARVPLMITGGFRSLAVMNQALADGKTAVIGIARPFCTQPDFPKRLMAGDIERTPVDEHHLVLGSGLLGPGSRFRTIRAVNNQGQAGWYYRQMIRLSRQQAPQPEPGVLGAFCRHMLNDWRLVLRRRLRGPGAAAASSGSPRA